MTVRAMNERQTVAAVYDNCNKIKNKSCYKFTKSTQLTIELTIDRKTLFRRAPWGRKLRGE